MDKGEIAYVILPSDCHTQITIVCQGLLNKWKLYRICCFWRRSFNVDFRKFCSETRCDPPRPGHRDAVFICYRKMGNSPESGAGTGRATQVVLIARPDQREATAASAKMFRMSPFQTERFRSSQYSVSNWLAVGGDFK